MDKREYHAGDSISFDRRFKKLTECGQARKHKPKRARKVSRVCFEMDTASKVVLVALAMLILFLIVN